MWGGRRSTGTHFTCFTGIQVQILTLRKLHSFAGCGVPTNVADFKKCRGRERDWKRVKVLVLDEVSMLDAAFVDWLDVTVRVLRGKCHSEKAFGGIQLIFSGDFLQLPAPGTKFDASITDFSRSLRKGERSRGEEEEEDRQVPVSMQQLRAYVFQSACFKEAKFRVVELTKVFRQVDRAFIQLLAKVRIGCVDREAMQFFGGQAMRRELPIDNIKPTQLFCTNAKVDEINRDELRKLDGRLQVYQARDSFSYHAEASEAGSRRLRACELVSSSSQVASTLSLKVGAQVMLTKNMAEWGLVNGSRGVVVDFITAQAAIERLERALLSPLAEEQLRYVEAAAARG